MRTLIISDIHSNLEALDAALEVASWDRVWVLGDLVGYGASPNEVVERISKLKPTLQVRGNHDKVCAGIEEPDSFSELAREAAFWTRRHLSHASLSYLRDLPKGPLTEGQVLLCHGSPRDEDEYLIADTQVWSQMDALGFSLCLFGHTHVPMLYRTADGTRNTQYLQDSTEISLEPGSRYFLNPGSIGQPRDGDPRGCFAILDSENEQIEIVKFEYKTERAAERILAADLPVMLAQRLFLGR